MPEQLILVNERDRAIGRDGKQAVHEAGRLHRAFSIFLLDGQGRVLLQQRALTKYHSGGLWANSCCGHPRPGEKTLQAARRRLSEELGVTAPLTLGFHARYSAEFANGLCENEFVHVYFGPAPNVPLKPDAREVRAVRWVGLAELRRDASARPSAYAYWLRYYLTRHAGELHQAVASAAPPPRRRSAALAS